jgi:predicted nucleic acid-binding protein
VRILLDTDVLLDVALARDPFAADSADVLRWAESGGAAAVAWHSVANCAYLLKGGGRPFLERLLRLVEVAPVATADARRALDLPLSEVEDAFQAAAALAWQADAIVTRTLVDHRRSPIPAVTPAQFLKRLRTA